MKRKTKTGLVLGPLALGSLVTLTTLNLSFRNEQLLWANQNQQQVPNQGNPQANQTLTVNSTNLKLDTENEQLSAPFKELLATLFPTDFQDLLRNTTKAQHFLNELVSYNGKENPLAFFKTNLDFATFYNNYSQARKGFFDPETAVTFQYDDTQNAIASVSNGVMQGKIKIGKNLQNQFQFTGNTSNGNSKNEVDFELNNLKTQFDIYFRNEAIGKPEWNKDNVADDLIVRPFEIQQKNGQPAKSLLEEQLLTMSKVEEYILDNLIVYDNKNGEEVPKDTNTNAILATNLTKNDFKKRNILKVIFVQPFVGSGKLQVNVSFNTNGKKNVWLDEKPLSLIDSRGTFSRLNDNVIKTFWLGGWKKDYSFNFLQNNNNKEFDAKTLILNPLLQEDFANALWKYSATEIEKMIINQNFDDLFKGLINFNAFLFKFINMIPPGGPNLPIAPQKQMPEKLLTTNLIFEEFKTLIQKNPFRFIVNNFNNNTYLDAFSGTFEGGLIVDKDLVQQHWVSTPTPPNGYNKFEPTSPTLLNFKLKNLHREIYFRPQEASFNNKGYVEVPWLAGQTIKDFFGLQNNTGANPTNGELDKVKEKILKNFVKYNHKNFNNPTEADFQQRVILTNAFNYDSLKSSVTMEAKNIQFNHAKGLLDLQFSFTFENGTLNDNLFANGTENTFSIPVKISGFQPDLTVGQYSFNPVQQVNQNNSVANIKDFNVNNPNGQLITQANEIDFNWIVDNLITFGKTNRAANNAVSIFETNATKEQFLNEMLYRGQPNNPGIMLQISPDQTVVNGTIYINKANVQNGPNFGINQNKDYYTYHFQVVGFMRQPNFDSIGTFNIKLQNPNLKLEELNQDYITNNLISFSDYQQPYAILKTNLTKADYFNTAFKSMQISKSFLNNQALVTINQQQDLVFQVLITGFESQPQFSLQNQIYIDDTNYSLATIQNIQVILQQFMNFDSTNNHLYSILNTNISQNEFENEYLDFINLNQKDFQGNWLDLTLHLKREIAGQTAHTFRIFFNKSQINIYNINRLFNIEKFDLSPNLFEKDEIINYISFNGSLRPEQALFAINLSKEEFTTQGGQIKVVGNPNPRNGSITFRFDFGQRLINVDDPEETNPVSVNFYEVGVFGFKSTAKINFNNKVNAAAFKETFKLINDISELNKKFIFDNLLSFNSQNEGIIGSTNLSKQELFDNTIINVTQEGKSAIINFTFRSRVNGNQTQQRVQIDNLAFLGYADFAGFNLALILSVAGISALFLLTLGGWSIHRIKKRKKIKQLYEATKNNKIF